MYSIPILLLIYNRPKKTKIVFNKIREIKPKKLFIVADGPKSKKDIELCNKARDVVRQIDWNCDLKKQFRKKNLGCKNSVEKGISWFFSNVESGIILEDDILPSDSFFCYASELLERYKDKKQIFSITGINWQKGIRRGESSYYFSKYPGIWGWATWADRWQLYDPEMKNLNDYLNNNRIIEVTDSEEEKNYHINSFINVKNKTVDSWDYVWKFTCFYHKGLCIVPNKNLIMNIGLDNEATHTKNLSVKTIRKDLKFPLIHPKKIKEDEKADKFMIKTRLGRKKKWRRITKTPYYTNKIYNYPSESCKEIIGTIKRKFNSQNKHIFITGFPKSGTTFISKVLSEAMGYELVPFINAYDQSEQDINENLLIDRLHKNTISQQHTRSNNRNLAILNKYNIKPLVIVRNIYDCVISFRDHCINEKNIWWPMAYIDNNFKELKKTQQIDFIIDLVIPWYINFYVGWQKNILCGKINANFFTYEQILEDNDLFFSNILDYYKINTKANIVKVKDAINKLNNSTKVRFNKGIKGRGVDVLTDEQKQQIITKCLYYYPNVNFKLIGVEL